MKTKYAFAALLVLISVCSLAPSQTVVITPKRTVYRRPKPLQDAKRTFAIRRPIAKAASPAVSRAITAAIDPVRVLDIRLKDELTDYQWLEEADYKVIMNRDGILCVNLSMYGTAAYPDSVERNVTVRTSDGHVLTPSDLFINLQGLAAKVKLMQRAEIVKSTEEIKRDPENVGVDPSQLFSEADFRVKDLGSFYISSQGASFVYDYGFPHVLEAVQPAGQFFFSWRDLKPFIKPAGLLARFVR